jgi:ring-1,2-phenylacetyl-CoA epoxidase subunit PaaE
MSKYHQLKIKEIVQETPDTVTIHFKQPLFGKIKYKSGQYITLLTNINGKNYRRCYSLCSSSETDDTLAVSVKKIENGIVSGFLNSGTVKVGDKMEIMSPMGNFIFEPQGKTDRQLLLIAAGSGITPMLSVIKTALAAETQSQILLLYGSKNKENIMFLRQLEDLIGKSKGRLRVVHFLSRSGDNVPGAIQGRMNAENIKIHIQNLPPKNTTAYLCGPAELTDAAFSLLENLEFTQIKRESFFLDDAHSQSFSGELTERSVKIHLENQIAEVLVSPETKILDAALDANLNMPYSCQSGLCTACRAKLLSGKVFMEVQEALSESELAQGYILTCQAHPLTDDVVLKVE